MRCGVTGNESIDTFAASCVEEEELWGSEGEQWKLEVESYRSKDKLVLSDFRVQYGYEGSNLGLYAFLRHKIITRPLHTTRTRARSRSHYLPRKYSVESVPPLFSMWG